MAEAAGKRVLAGGNLGRPALDLLDDPVPELYVLELSSFQLETTRSLRTAAAVVLNVTPDHMDRYETLGEYAAAKARIFSTATPPSSISTIRGARDAASCAARARRSVCARIRRPTTTRIAQGEDVALMHGRERQLVAMSELKIAGLHNAANALAALAMCDALRLPRERVRAGAARVSGLPHRSQWVADVRGVRYVDDSKGTNVGATLAAVAGMPGSLVLIAGGQGKGQDFAPLAAAFRGKVRHVVLIGQDAKVLAAALEGVATHRVRAATWTTPCSARRAPRVPAKRFCCRPRARVSTCFATTRIAATCSPPPCGGCDA